jgi:hypothetical protein
MEVPDGKEDGKDVAFPARALNRSPAVGPGETLLAEV